MTAQAEAEKIRCIGEAEAGSIEAVGKAEAEKMRLKAEAYQQYGDAAKTALVLEALPKVCDALLHERPTLTWEFCSWPKYLTRGLVPKSSLSGYLAYVS